MSYRKNKARRDMINRFGETAGLPLFENAVVPVYINARMQSAPKQMELATETKKGAERLARADGMKLAEKQIKILDVLALGGDWTNEEIAHRLDWEINRVTGRVFELRELGLVVPSTKRECSVTGMIVQAWRAK